MEQVHRWHQTKLGLFVFLLAELLLIYTFASLSIARGNLWYYLLTFLFLVAALQNIAKLIWKVVRFRA